tara:strand:+ start:117 stop:494 length:378 start_codon:yes stop_codon:yes gene_type:complete
VDWIKNDTTNWRKINDVNGGTYQYFARMNKKNAIAKYDEARRWYDVNWSGKRLGKLSNWTGRILLDIEWTCDGYDYPELVMSWIKNDITNWKKLNDENTNIIFIETYIIKGKGYNASCYYHTSSP